jgi:p-aminobenzoyl-glutamate transporter AbgT
VTVQGLLTGDGLAWLLANGIPNFTGFPALGTVLLMTLAVGVAERAGLLETLVRATVARAPSRLLPYAGAFVACQAHVMSDVASVVVPPLAAVAFTASVSLLLAGLGGFLIARVLEPRLPQPVADSSTPDATGQSVALSPAHRRGLILSGLAVLGYLAVVIAGWLLPNSPLRGKGGTLVPSPLLSGIVPVLFVLFLLAAVVYGFTARTLTKAADVPKLMAEGVTGMAGSIVLIFAIGQVIGLEPAFTRRRSASGTPPPK